MSTPAHELAESDRPWIIRTYAGHSSAKASNELYRSNLEKGQTGLSTAFDLPTLMGLDSDDPRSLGEVGRLGVTVDTLDDGRRVITAAFVLLCPGSRPAVPSIGS